MKKFFKNKESLLVSCVLVATVIGITLFSIYRSSGEWPLKTSSSENIKSEMIRNHPEITKVAFSDWYGQNLKVSFHSGQEWSDETVGTIIKELSGMLQDDTFQEEYFKVYKSRYGKTETERMNAVICFYSRSNVYKFQYLSVYPFEKWSVRKYE